MAAPMQTSAVLQFWGKARPGDGSRAAWHPVAYHLLDVAAVADAMLAARPITVRRAGWLLGLADEDARRLLVALTALHDLGKFAPAFQRQATPDEWTWPRALGGARRAPFAPSRHTSDGLLLWQKRLRSDFAARIWSGELRGWQALEMAIFGHHGLPVKPQGLLSEHYSDGAVAAAYHCTKLVLDCVPLQPITVASLNRKRLAIASWWLAGFMTVADWVGSRQEWFEYTSSGKTEAAQMLVHRLMAKCRASGAYWAMPTQATANAMYGRQCAAISALFVQAAGAKPSLTLGHGQARVHKSFRSTVI